MLKYKNEVSNISLKWKKSKFDKIKITSSKDTQDFARNFYHDDINIYESFFIILLNNNNETIAWAKISQGGIMGTTVDIKIIAKYCIESLASSCILVHNHPSGVLNPSKQDLSITSKIKQALSLFDCLLLDHIILTKDNYYSFADEGIL